LPALPGLACVARHPFPAPSAVHFAQPDSGKEPPRALRRPRGQRNTHTKPQSHEGDRPFRHPLIFSSPHHQPLAPAAIDRTRRRWVAGQRQLLGALGLRQQPLDLAFQRADLRRERLQLARPLQRRLRGREIARAEGIGAGILRVEQGVAHAVVEKFEGFVEGRYLNDDPLDVVSLIDVARMLAMAATSATLLGVLL